MHSVKIMYNFSRQTLGREIQCMANAVIVIVEQMYRVNLSLNSITEVEWKEW